MRCTQLFITKNRATQTFIVEFQKLHILSLIRIVTSSDTRHKDKDVDQMQHVTGRLYLDIQLCRSQRLRAPIDRTFNTVQFVAQDGGESFRIGFGQVTFDGHGRRRRNFWSSLQKYVHKISRQGSNIPRLTLLSNYFEIQVGFQAHAHSLHTRNASSLTAKVSNYRLQVNSVMVPIEWTVPSVYTSLYDAAIV
jgi:hypothetical protein